MSRARFIPAARRELLAEVSFHNEVQSGLGQRFLEAVEAAVSLALAFPLAGSPSPAKTRTVLVRGFRFSVVYRPAPDGIVVFAVAHHSRRPSYWHSRTQ